MQGILERPVLAAIAVLRVIIGTLVPADAARSIISADEVQAWQSRYLAWFDKNSGHFEADSTAVRDMRENAVREFNELMGLVKYK
jgi:hypothetical protein